MMTVPKKLQKPKKKSKKNPIYQNKNKFAAKKLMIEHWGVFFHRIRFVSQFRSQWWNPNWWPVLTAFNKELTSPRLHVVVMNVKHMQIGRNYSKNAINCYYCWNTRTSPSSHSKLKRIGSAGCLFRSCDNDYLNKCIKL